jgi:hypothetical protein
VRLEVDKSLPADATVTYKFENGQTTYGNFSISGATLSFNTGANASATAYTCKIKATITGNTTYAGTTQTVSTSITVTKINFPDLGNLLLDGTFHQDINPTTISLNTAKQYTLSLSNSAPLNTTFSYTCISRTANTGYFPSASSFTISGSTLSISAITTPGSFYLTIRVTATNSPNYND